MSDESVVLQEEVDEEAGSKRRKLNPSFEKPMPRSNLSSSFMVNRKTYDQKLLLQSLKQTMPSPPKEANSIFMGVVQPVAGDSRRKRLQQAYHEW